MPTKKKTLKRPAKRAPKKHTRQRPESVRARGLAASLTVNDLPKSLGWYTDILGFTQASKWEDGGTVRGAELKAGTTRLILNQDDWAKGRDRAKGLGMRLYFSTAQNLDTLAQRIKAKGGALDSEPQRMPWGSYSFSLTDPDGFRLTFTQVER